MRKWRKEARKHNLAAGRSHQGRINQMAHIELRGLPSILFLQMFMKSAKEVLTEYDNVMSRYEKNQPELEPVTE